MREPWQAAWLHVSHEKAWNQQMKSFFLEPYFSLRTANKRGEINWMFYTCSDFIQVDILYLLTEKVSRSKFPEGRLFLSLCSTSDRYTSFHFAIDTLFFPCCSFHRHYSWRIVREFPSHNGSTKQSLQSRDFRNFYRDFNTFANNEAAILTLCTSRAYLIDTGIKFAMMASA